MTKLRELDFNGNIKKKFLNFSLKQNYHYRSLFNEI